MGENYCKETLYATVLLTIDKNISWSLEYYLMTYPGSTGKELYGVRIDKRDPNYYVVDKSETFAMTESYDKALAILSHLANGMVRPLEMLTIIDDWVSGDEWSGTSPTPPNERPSHTEV